MAGRTTAGDHPDGRIGAGHRVSTPEPGPKPWLLHRRGSSSRTIRRRYRGRSPGGLRRPITSDSRRERRRCAVDTARRSHPLRSTVDPLREAGPWVTIHRSSAGSRAERAGPKPRALDTRDRKTAPSPAPESRGGVHVPMGPGSSSRASNSLRSASAVSHDLDGLPLCRAVRHVSSGHAPGVHVPTGMTR
jgi:hypothetical protein